jgi:peptidoglycan/LPS O-acetylase OafA/YrhL
MPELDGLRAFAVGSVILAHYTIGTQLAERVDWGAYGVWLFFVLSGFLITRILLRCRARVAEGATSAGFVLGRFYARRFLRIFPIYYLTVIVICLGSEKIREQVWWLLGYALNLKVALDGKFSVAPHFWSLAVEEQFYLAWPCLILFASRKFLPWVLVSLVVLAPCWRAAVLLNDGSVLTARVFTLGCLDTLALGGLLALVRDDVVGSKVWAQRLPKIAFRLGLPLTLLALTLHASKSALTLKVVVGDFGVALLLCAVVARASEGWGGRVGRVLSHPAAIYVGRISYGLYVYHLFVPPILRRVAERFEWEWLASKAFQSPIALVISLGMAAASWHLLERPLNALKRHVPYEPPASED